MLERRVISHVKRARLRRFTSPWAKASGARDGFGPLPLAVLYSRARYAGPGPPFSRVMARSVGRSICCAPAMELDAAARPRSPNIELQPEAWSRDLPGGHPGTQPCVGDAGP